MDPKRKKRKSDSRAARFATRAWAAADDGDFNIACKEICLAVAESENNAVTWHDYGAIHAMPGHSQEAEQGFRNAILVAPTYCDAYVQLASLLAGRGRTIQAARYQRRAVELKPDVRLYQEQLADYEKRASESGEPPSSPSADEAD